MADRRNILVIGATGKQGGAVVAALCSLPASSPPLHVLAVTRNPESAGARALAARYAGKVSLVTGDLKNPKAIFATQAKGSVAAAFLVTVMGKDEEASGKAFIDAAAEHAVPHIVFTSVERGGNEHSWDNPTDVPHFISKHRIELYLRERSRDGLTYTILRPVAFLDNFSPGRGVGILVALWRAALSPTTKLQHVAVRDIGVFAARALTEPADRWADRAIGLAGEDMTLAEAQAKFKATTGKDLPDPWGGGIVARLMLWGVADVARMCAFFEREGYAINIAALRAEAGEHGLWDFETWLRESKWDTPAKPASG